MFGFAPYWDMANWKLWQLQRLSTVAYFGVTLDGNGNPVHDEGWTAWTGQQLTDLVSAAHAAGVRVLVTIKCFDTPTISSIVSTPAHAQQAVATAISLARQRGLDGVDVDFEGATSPTYPTIAQDLTSFMGGLTAATHAAINGSEVVVDTYSGSASWDGGLFNIGALAPNVDAFFVMAYDMNFDNTPGHASADAPLNGGTYNDTTLIQQYLSKAPASKVILGIPYYGYKWNVGSPGPNAPDSGSAVADTYSGTFDDFSCAPQLTKQWDATAASPWATWWSPATADPCGGNHNSWREMYYEDVTSIGAKYDLANQSNIRGMGIWALGYDDGHTELWDLIAGHVNVSHAPVAQAVSPAGPVTSTAFTVSWGVAAGSVPATSYQIFVSQDGGAWAPWLSTSATSATFHGFAGHGYAFYAEAFGAGGYGSGAPNASTPAQPATHIAPGATPAEPFTGLYAVDAYGGLLPGSSPALPPSAAWPGWRIVRGRLDGAGRPGRLRPRRLRRHPPLRIGAGARHQRLLVGVGHRPRPRHLPRRRRRVYRRRLGRRPPGRRRPARLRHLVLAAVGHRPGDRARRLRPGRPPGLGGRRLGRRPSLRRRRGAPGELLLAGMGHRPGDRLGLHRRTAGRLRPRRLGRGPSLRCRAGARHLRLLAGLGHRPRARHPPRRGRRLRRRRLGRVPPDRRRPGGRRTRVHPGPGRRPRRDGELTLSDRRLRIVTPRFGEAVVGGAEAVARDLALRLGAAGWRVEVLTTCAVEAVTWANRLPAGTSYDGPVTVHRHPTAIRRPPRLFHQLSRVVFRLPPALRPEALWVALQGPFSPGLVRALAAAPAAPTLFLPYLYHPALRGAPRSRGARLLMPAAHEERPLCLRSVARLVAAVDGFLYATPEERALLESAHPAAAQRAWRVGNTGIDAPADVDPGRARARLGLDGPYLLHAGRAATGKGIDDLLAALTRLRGTHPEVRLVLAGDAGAPAGDDRRGGPGGPGWSGSCSGTRSPAPPRWWCRATSRASPCSPSRPGRWAGRPCSTAPPRRSPGRRRGSGGAILYRGPAELAAAAEALLDDPDRGAALGACGRRFVEDRYRWAAVLEGVTALVDEAERRAALRGG